MTLTNDVRTLILTYLPLKTLQIIDDMVKNPFSVTLLTNLLLIKYNIKIDLQPQTIDKLVLEPFELYTKTVMRLGQIGYNGQFYLPPYACLFNSIKNNDLDLLQYYLLRYFGNDFDITKEAINWLIGDQKLYNILIYLSNKDSKNIIKQFYSKTIEGTDLINFNKSKLSIINNQVDKAFYFDLLNFNSTKLDQYITFTFPFPFINADTILYVISKNDSFIKTETIVKANVMYDKINTLFPPSINRDYYLNLLAILLNKDVNINTISNHLSNYVVGLALSVMNFTFISQLADDWATSLAPENIVISEVLYDIKFINTDMPNWIKYMLTISIYLSNNAIILTNPIPLVQTYENIRLFNKVKIYDPETALRLVDVINVKPYLLPLTDFDKNLMIQFDLL